MTTTFKFIRISMQCNPIHIHIHIHIQWKAKSFTFGSFTPALHKSLSFIKTFWDFWLSIRHGAIWYIFWYLFTFGSQIHPPSQPLTSIMITMFHPLSHYSVPLTPFDLLKISTFHIAFLSFFRVKSNLLLITFFAFGLRLDVRRTAQHPQVKRLP